MRISSVAVAVLAATASGEVFFEEDFQDESWEKRWVSSAWKGGNGPAGKFEWTSGDWSGDEANKGLRTGSNMHYHCISSKLPKPFSNKGKTLVLQYTVKNERKEFSFCGGGYIKLMGSKIDQPNFGGDTDYNIMFGPDLCGYDIARIHLIFNWKGKNLLKNSDIKLDYDDKNEYTHLYTLVLKPDNTYEVYFDLKEKSKGSLHELWDYPNKTHDDPNDSKPKDWIDDKKMDDPNQKKPDDWEDEKKIRDPEAFKPDEWDDDEDGTWEAPLIDNPKYKGAWTSSRVDNPAYKGEWKAKQLPNPDYVEDVYIYEDIGSIGFELWTVNNGSIFDNLLVTDSFEHAKSVAEKVWKPFVEKEKDAKKAFDKEKGKGGADTASSSSDGDDDDDDSEDKKDEKKDEI